MADLPEALRPYFEALAFGLEGLLPPCRIENRPWLLSLQEALEEEEHLTVPDLEHLKTILAMADRVVVPPIRDLQTGCEAEAVLLKAGLPFTEHQIRLAMRWLLLLLGRHGRVEIDLANVEEWLRIWRRVQAFDPEEQAFVRCGIYWMLSKSFSSNTIEGNIREYQKFRVWMAHKKLDSMAQIGNLELQRYLLERACGYLNSSKQQILGRIRPWLYFYQEAIDGAYRVPDYTVKVSRAWGVSASASSEEIERLEEALLEQRLPAMAGLMLLLIIGYGLPLKTLPHLEIAWEPGVLTYTERLPCRLGVGEDAIRLDLSQPWLVEYWHGWMRERKTGETAYLFTSGHGLKRLRPVSVEYCQRAVKASVKNVLGYAIPVNHLERGALKRFARLTSLTQFMMLTDELPKGHLSRMMVWMAMQ